MRRSLKSFKSSVGFLAAIMLAALVGGLTSNLVRAGVPDANGIITACVRSNGGDIHIIDTEETPAESCSNKEVQISWSQNGAPIPGDFLSNLDGADLSDHILKYRSFKNAQLTNTTLIDVIFTGSIFEGADLEGASIGRLTGGDFRGANFEGVSVTESLTYGDYRNIDFTDVEFHDTECFMFNYSNLGGADLSGQSFPCLYINATDISGANFSNTIFSGSDSYIADSGTITGDIPSVPTVASGTNFTNASFTDVRFNGTDLSTAILTGATWNNVTCPDGSNSSTHSNSCTGHLVP